MLYSDVLMLSYISHMLLPFVRAKDLVDPQEKGIESTGGTQGQLWKYENMSSYENMETWKE